MKHTICYGPFGRETSYADLAEEVGPGWRPMVIYLAQVCKAHGVTVAQVKEKFGGLRFYVNGSTEEVHKVIEAAEAMSYKICERCGAPGRPREPGWILTLCDDCHISRRSTLHK